MARLKGMPVLPGGRVGRTISVSRRGKPTPCASSGPHHPPLDMLTQRYSIDNKGAVMIIGEQ